LILLNIVNKQKRKARQNLLNSLKYRNFSNQMYFMTITDEITIIANQLANQGKKPTVALIKTKLAKAVPLPTIITTLKAWTYNPELTTFNKSEPDAILQEQKNITLSPEVEKALNLAVERAIQPLKIEIAQLKALLVNLQKNS